MASLKLRRKSNTKAIRGFQGLRGQRLSMILGQNFDSLDMFLIITCLYILENLKDILKIMFRDDANAWNDKEIQISYPRPIFDDEVIFWRKKENFENDLKSV